MHEPSYLQQHFLLHRKREQYFIALARIFVFLLFLGFWEASARFGLIDSFIFSSPSRIGRTFLTMCKDHSLFSHIRITLTETLVSFFLCMLFGIGTAVLLWTSPKLSKITEPYLVILNSLPKSALAPLLIVWLGANERTIIVSGISVAIFGSVINLYTGFREVDPEKLKLIETLGGGKKEELTKIVLPSSIPLILSTMKVNIGLCLVGVIIGEFIGAKEGLGYLIIYGSQTFICAHIWRGCDIVFVFFFVCCWIHLFFLFLNDYFLLFSNGYCQNTRYAVYFNKLKSRYYYCSLALFSLAENDAPIQLNSQRNQPLAESGFKWADFVTVYRTPVNCNTIFLSVTG